MVDGRWYPSLTVLNDGRILAMGGKSGSLNPWYELQINRISEVYTVNIGWEEISSSSSSNMPGDISYFYPAGNLIPFGSFAGKVFFSTTALIPIPNPGVPPPEFIYSLENPGYAQIFDPSPSGSRPYWQSVGNLRESPTEVSNHVLLPIRLGSSDSRILVFGGQWGDVLSRVDMINLADSNPEWTTIDPMDQARWRHNSIILPDRKILVVGGENENGPVMEPELLDTDTLTWVDLSEPPFPTMEIPRKYHSSALLLPNGKVFLGGGRVTDGGDVEDDTERRITIFEPGYLMDGDQPKISTAPNEVTYQEVFTVEMNGTHPLDSMAFIKPMSVTHGYVSEQRYIELAFEEGIGSGVYNVTAPDNPNIAPPGYYMLFVMKDVSESISGESRIPSNAKFIKLSLS